MYMASGKQVLTKVDGSYEVDGLFSGTYTVSASKEDYIFTSEDGNNQVLLSESTESTLTFIGARVKNAPPSLKPGQFIVTTGGQNISLRIIAGKGSLFKNVTNYFIYRSEIENLQGTTPIKKIKSGVFIDKDTVPLKKYYYSISSNGKSDVTFQKLGWKRGKSSKIKGKSY